MARQPRVEHEGAVHHVMSRGNDGITIFRDDEDRQLFLRLLGEEVARSRWVLHDYCLMGNHYHLAIGTSECTLSSGMHRLLSRYAQRFNKRHRRRGHLFEQRFKNILVEQQSHGLVLSRYIALNPVRARLCERPEQWPWSSYAARVGIVETPVWLTPEPLMGDFGPTPDAQRQAYREFVCAGLGLDEDADAIDGLFLGTTAWIERIQNVIDQVDRSQEHPRAQVHPGRPELEDVVEAVAKTFDTTCDAIREGRGTFERRLVAWFTFEEGLVPLRRIAQWLGLSSAGGVSNLVSRCREELKNDATARELADACRRLMRRRPPPFLLPAAVPPLTARRFHRAQPRRRR